MRSVIVIFLIKQYLTKVILTHFRPMFLLCRNQVVGFYKQNVWKTPAEEWQLPGLSICGSIVENGLRIILPVKAYLMCPIFDSKELGKLVGNVNTNGYFEVPTGCVILLDPLLNNHDVNWKSCSWPLNLTVLLFLPLPRLSVHLQYPVPKSQKIPNISICKLYTQYDLTVTLIQLKV